jgi:hypothetical protein
MYTFLISMKATVKNKIISMVFFQYLDQVVSRPTATMAGYTVQRNLKARTFQWTVVRDYNYHKIKDSALQA